MEKHVIPIWFFIGLLLTVYGALILGAGIYQLIAGSESGVAMPQLHIGIWWGAGILPLGLAYLIHDWPGRRKDS